MNDIIEGEAAMPNIIESGASGLHTAPLNGPEKAAVIIGLLGAKHAGPIVRRFMQALTSLPNISREIMLSAVADFMTQLERRKGGFKGGVDVTRAVMEELFDPDEVTRLFGMPVVKTQPEGAIEVWAEMKKANRDDLVKYLSTLRGEVVSIILSQFPPSESGEILTDLPEDLSVICVNHMAMGAVFDDQTLAAVAELVRDDFLLMDNTDTEKEAAMFVSEVLGILPRDRREQMLKVLEETDPAKATLIRGAMLTFEDLPKRLPTSAVPIIFKDFDSELLLQALKVGAEQSAAAVEFLYANISQRMAGTFKEDVEDLKSVSSKEGDKAISALMGFIGTLEKDGRIVLIKIATETDE